MRCPFRQRPEQPRPGEVDGREYFFRTTEQFEEMIGQDALIEYAQYVGNYYGTPKAYVEQQLAAGKDVILEIEIQGALKDQRNISRIPCSCFVTPPSDGCNVTGASDRAGERKTTDDGQNNVWARAVEEAVWRRRL